MRKRIALKLNKYNPIPKALESAGGVAVEAVDVPLKDLYHHYYLDSYGCLPKIDNPAHFEPVNFLTNDDYWRFKESGFGKSTGAKRNRSAELGQAFCRWFLSTHLDIVYFAHMSDVLGAKEFDKNTNLRVERILEGDAPDYLCADANGKVYVGEAKGRYDAISFGNKRFDSWRKQFERIALKDDSGKAISVKGHIVATRFATEMDSAAIKSGIWAEDPATPGESTLNPEQSNNLFHRVKDFHYHDIMLLLGQSHLAFALRSRYPIPSRISISFDVWAVNMGPLAGKKFVGGYIGSRARHRIHSHVQPWRNSLTFSDDMFFGLEYSVFIGLVVQARQDTLFEAPSLQFEGDNPEMFSIMSDGTLIAPLQFLTPLEMQEL